ncbi:MAG: Nif3-like dinuclear metal center hexameric protein [Lachnospiraceae bacterium]|jgi:dinuclear metal center YbgI/SA1388 family protein|nr:Nif3-like dinuclear metal center hexameric protein [Lachnospiraceae bacterium]
MECREILEVLNRLADVSWACEWDNVGLLAGRRDKEVHRVTVALDADDRAVKEALQNGSDLLVTHHPLLFAPVKRITDESAAGRRLLTILRHDLCVISMHTNFDAAPGGMADLAADRLGLLRRSVLSVTGRREDAEYGIGVIGEAPAGDMRLEQLCARVKEAFGLDTVQLYAPEGAGPVRRIALCPGSGKDEIGPALTAGAQVLVTGDITYHYAQDAVEEGLAVIDAGHYGLEHIFIPFIKAYLKKQLPALSVDTVQIRQPARFL